MSVGAPEIVAALLGAMATGLFQVIDRILSRRRRSESILVAIATEVRSILDLIEHQQYVEAIAEQTRAIRQGTWDGHGYIIDVRSNYFGVYESLASELGSLQPHQIRKIVAFYAFCKSAIDSTRPDGPFAGEVDEEDKKGNLLSLEGLFMAIRHIGDEILAMPKKPIPPAIESAILNENPAIENEPDGR